MHRELTISLEEGRRQRWGVRKSRQFRGYLLGMVEADPLWDLGGAKAQRPVWMAYAASRGMARPFAANARCGRRIEHGMGSSLDDCLEFPRSSGHRWVSQEAGEGAVITTAYLPELFHLDPVVPPERVRFICMAPRWWVAREGEKLRSDLGADAEDAARAGLFSAYLDRRVALPILSELRFQLRLYRHVLASDLRVKPREYRRSRDGIAFEGMEACGLDEPIAIDASHEAVEAFITEQVQRYYDEEVRDGQDRKRRGRGVLPSARSAPVQLCFDFAA